MMNQGGESTIGLDPNLMKGPDMKQANYSWSSSTQPIANTWNAYGTNTAPIENGSLSNSSYQYDTQTSVTIDTHNLASSLQASASSSYGAPNVSQQYPNYAPYSTSTQPYTYTNTEYQNYYNYQQPSDTDPSSQQACYNYQQPSVTDSSSQQASYNYQQPSVTDPSSQQSGTVQNSSAPYQSYSSYQSTGSYVPPPSYTSTYYNSGDHQTSAYANQTSYWNGSNYENYPPQQYSNYTSTVDNSNQVTSNVASNSIHYQQYTQWPYYYPPAPNVSCAPGTETTMATSASPAYPVSAAAGGGYSCPTNQPPPPGTTSWRNESGPSESSILQDKMNATIYNQNSSLEVAAPASQKPQINQISSHIHTSTNLTPRPKYADQQTTVHSQAFNLQSTTTNHVLEHFQSSAQINMSETNRVSKIQIPTNPRIASSLIFGMSKGDKESSTTNASQKPAYVSIHVLKHSTKLPSHGDSEDIMKGTLPASLRTYVERTFARCKDDFQRAANQKLMKEVITKASADGTLFTKNWDIEPLFPLTNSMINEASQNVQTPITFPTKRKKSRWEPVSDDKLSENLASVNYDLTKSAEKMVDGQKVGSNDSVWNGIKFLSTPQQTSLSKNAYRAEKKPRFNVIANASENGDVSNENDKVQSLTKYYASAIALADSPEEKKRREHRSKRFEKAQQNKAEIKHYRPKISENKFTRLPSGSLLDKFFEANQSRAVEDMDWDALTVKGTCQDVEKRYLRLTSAPDPATVRPEEILEKALLMVQTSQKNYLYKCDQLKSIRQDLTVQRIHNELTVKVYETHARLALEAGDLPEYNQCQSQLKCLYAEGINGCHTEFSAYNLLCVILHSNNNRDLLSAMARLSVKAKDDDAVKHALAVRSAVSSGNYIRFFRLYKSAPNLNTSLMDLYVEKMRFNAVKCICKSYRPTIPVSYVACNLGFSSELLTIEGEDKDTGGLDECEEWLKAHGAVLIVDNNGELQVDTKVTAPSLFMPEPEDAVAHGDANLAVNDFLTRAAS